MTETEFIKYAQTLTKEELITLLKTYRNVMSKTRELLLTFVQHNMGQDPLHKQTCKYAADSYEMMLNYPDVVLENANSIIKLGEK